MNKRQLICMWGGIAVFVFVGLTTTTSYSNADTTWADCGPLMGRLLSTAAVTAGLIYTLKDKKPKDE